jgi:stage II sporulation protein D
MRGWLAALGCLYVATVVGAQLPVSPDLDARRVGRDRVAAPATGGVAARSTGIPPNAAWLLRETSGGTSRESRADILDTPVLPGSLIKPVTLVAALESGTIQPDTTHMCRRSVSVGGQRYSCSHPDLRRPMTAAEALAHSCNDFFVSLTSRLPRAALDSVRVRLGLQPVPASANYAAALVGLDGPRTSPRALLGAYERLLDTAAGGRAPISMTARRVLIEGLTGAATYGSASELAEYGIGALAKTGTSSMPRGGVLGMAVVLNPAAAGRAQRALIVVAPGAAGRDAVSIAADLMRTRRGSNAPNAPNASNASNASHDVHIRLASLDSSRVESMNLEDYVARVVAAEADPTAGPAALRAVAIAARTFTIANRGRHEAEGFDMCDTTHCQVVRTATAASRAAAAATARRVLLRRGAVAPVHYSAWCGGHTEAASHIWPGAVDAGAARHDAACAGEPGWRTEIPVTRIEDALRAMGLRGTSLRSLQVAARNATGRVTRLRADGFTPSEVPAEPFRMALGRAGGWQLMKSTMFELTRSPRGYVITGKGSGHGVGLCVIGAGRRAAAGESTERILAFYYPELAIGVVPAGTWGPASAGAPKSGPDVDGDIAVALPAAEEPFRATLTQLIRRARDEIADKAGIAARPAVRVTVHPTVESFGRATGRRSWFAGATSGNSIELMPLTVLRSRGLLDGAVRHEVAHVVIDRELAGRPLWVREGAAAHFSGGTRLGGMMRSTGPCPTDDELISPRSDADARDAYRRAETCFLTAIRATGWRDIR